MLLFGLYLVVKYFGTEWINWLLQWYFTIAGTGSGSKASESTGHMSVRLELNDIAGTYLPRALDSGPRTLEAI